MNSRAFGKEDLLQTEGFCLSAPPRQTKTSFLRDLCVSVVNADNSMLCSVITNSLALGDAAVVIFESFDVVFFEVVAVLDFNDLKGATFRIFDTVLRVDRDKGTLAFLNKICFVLSCHFCCSFNNNPVFTPSPVKLKA